MADKRTSLCGALLKGKNHPINLRNTWVRWFCLFFFCFSTFGNYFASDLVLPLQTALLEIFKINNAEFNLVYTSYTLPSAILPIFAGLLVDKVGIRTSYILFGFLTVIGAILMAEGVAMRVFNLLLLGKGIIGTAGECLFIAKTAIVIKWFYNKELAFALGTTLSISRIGTSLSAYSAPRIYESAGEITAPFWFGAKVCIFSLFCILLVSLVDWYADYRDHEVKAEVTDGPFKIEDLKNLSKLYYLILWSCILAYASILGFLMNGADMMVKRFGYSPTLAGSRLSVVYFMGALTSPILGGIVDRYGKRASLMIVSIVFMIGTHLTTLLLDDKESPDYNNGMWAPLLCMGICYSIYAAILWPSISLVVEKKVRGTAYGLITCLDNLGVAGLAIFNGWLHDHTIDFHVGYFWPSFSMLIQAVLALIVNIMIYFEDRKTGSMLERGIGKMKDPNNITPEAYNPHIDEI